MVRVDLWVENLRKGEPVAGTRVVKEIELSPKGVMEYLEGRKTYDILGECTLTDLRVMLYLITNEPMSGPPNKEWFTLRLQDAVEKYKRLGATDTDPLTTALQRLVNRARQSARI